MVNWGQTYSRVCDCADCSCCYHSSWNSCAQDILSGHHPYHLCRCTVVDDNNINVPDRAEKQVAWWRVKSKAMMEEARIIVVSWWLVKIRGAFIYSKSSLKLFTTVHSLAPPWTVWSRVRVLLRTEWPFKLHAKPRASSNLILLVGSLPFCFDCLWLFTHLPRQQVRCTMQRPWWCDSTNFL